MRDILAEIDIEATPRQVWSVLVDFERYGEWNPFIIEMHGKAAVGERVKELVRLPNGKTFTFATRIIEVVPEQRLIWKGHLGHPFLFLGQHRILLSPLSVGQETRLTQQEDYTGLVSSLIDVKQTMAGYHEMNRALKERVESLRGRRDETPMESQSI